MADCSKQWLGAGPRILGGPLLIVLAAGVLRAALPDFAETAFLPPMAGWIVGGLLAAAGLLLYLASMPYLRRAVRGGRLVTDGPFRLCRHPLYASWLLGMMPGAALLLRSWIALGGWLVGFVLFAAFIRMEERRLRQRFGEAYDAYSAATRALLPLPRRRSVRS
jgi:protein-S-isoprenylcysteine O-methyltransferase Ste14